jgi:hypothetical protein
MDGEALRSVAGARLCQPLRGTGKVQRARQGLAAGLIKARSGSKGGERLSPELSRRGNIGKLGKLPMPSVPTSTARGQCTASRAARE